MGYGQINLGGCPDGQLGIPPACIPVPSSFPVPPIPGIPMPPPIPPLVRAQPESTTPSWLVPALVGIAVVSVVAIIASRKK